MMLGTYYIGYEGIRKSALTWQGLRWGLAQGYISHADILRYASDRLKEDSSDLEYELYQCKPDHTYRVDGILAELARHEGSPELTDPDPGSTDPDPGSTDPDPGSTDPRHALWLYLLLKHVYEHRKNFDDPLGEVEILHADFGYPEDVTPFVRYMPPTDYDPSTYTRQENIDRLYALWEAYLYNHKP